MKQKTFISTLLTLCSITFGASLANAANIDLFVETGAIYTPANPLGTVSGPYFVVPGDNVIIKSAVGNRSATDTTTGAATLSADLDGPFALLSTSDIHCPEGSSPRVSSSTSSWGGLNQHVECLGLSLPGNSLFYLKIETQVTSCEDLFYSANVASDPTDFEINSLDNYSPLEVFTTPCSATGGSGGIGGSGGVGGSMGAGGSGASGSYLKIMEVPTALDEKIINKKYNSK